MLEAPPVKQAGWTWQQCLVHARRDASELDDDQYLELRYESLTAEPAQTLRTLFSWADLDSEAFFTPDRNAALNQIHPAEPTWKSQLDAEQKALLNDLLGPLLREYGYHD
jgi:hypothetical protein